MLPCRPEVPLSYSPAFSPINGLKQFGRGVKEVAYNTFASNASYTAVLEDHANKELFEAIKLHSEDATTHGEKVVEILRRELLDMGVEIKYIKINEQGKAVWINL